MKKNIVIRLLMYSPFTSMHNPERHPDWTKAISVKLESGIRIS